MLLQARCILAASVHCMPACKPGQLQGHASMPPAFPPAIACEAWARKKKCGQVTGEQVRPQVPQCEVFRSAVQYAAIQGLETPTYEVMHTLWVRRLCVSSSLPHYQTRVDQVTVCSVVLAATHAWPMPVVDPVGLRPHEM